MKVSYAITVKDELNEIKTLLETLFNYIKQQDEIVILWDEKNGDPKVWEYLKSITQKTINTYKSSFQNHFANWKNYLNSLCSGEYIYNIDADEIPSEYLVKNLKVILEANLKNDVFYVPRINKVEGITQKHIEKWKWKINNKGWINFPDYQMRIYKNSPEIKWVGKVHEYIKGYKTYAVFPQDEIYSLKHYKSIERQEKQNKYYNTL